MDHQLMQYTESGGCGCKLAPTVLETILSYNKGSHIDKNVLVGNSNKDDAGIYQISEFQSIVSTVDFFTPIVNDPYTYGQIAAANAISDVYAMGGKPLWAMAILGFPIDVLDPMVGKTIVEGANSICEKARVSIIGGHTINNPQPIFGLVVNGIIDTKNIKQNKNAKIGDFLFLTKPIGVGILSTALKLGKIEKNHYDLAVQNMLQLNSIGMKLAELEYVNAMTDITGFGLLGHLLEICNSSEVGAELNFDKVLVLDGVVGYINQNIITSGGKRNWESFKDAVLNSSYLSKIILSDPQTNGGILVTIPEKFIDDFKLFLTENNLEKYSVPIGRIVSDPKRQISIC